jgi:hypothetical protein
MSALKVLDLKLYSGCQRTLMHGDCYKISCKNLVLA